MANFPVNSFVIPGGQGANAKGTIWGLKFAPSLDSGSVISSLTEKPHLETKKVTLIILDDFRFSASNRPTFNLNGNGSGFKWIGNSALGRLKPEFASPSSNHRRKKAKLADEDVTHGSLVLLHTLNLLDEFARVLGSNFRQISSDYVEPSNPRSFLYRMSLVTNGMPSNRSEIEIIAVDIHNVSTVTIATRMEKAIEAATSERVVVNMSFGLLPEEHVKGFEASTHDTFQDYLEQLDPSSNHEDTLKSILQNVNSESNSDSLFKRIEDYLQQPSTGEPELFAFVAAAGNYFPRTIPLTPASWDNIVSISALDKNLNLASFSHNGEIKAPGEVEIKNNVSVEGTSFAAPFVSVFAALDMTATTPLATYATPATSNHPSKKANLDHIDWVWGTPPTMPNRPVNDFTP